MSFTAIDLDDLLAGSTPEEIEAMKAASPPAWRDQLHAAMRDAVDGAEKNLKKPSRWVERERIPEWLRLGMYDAIVGWWNGTARTCLHDPRLDAPEPVLAAAWRPGLVVCGRCSPMLAAHGDADKICDGCGHLCVGLPEDGIYPVSVLAGGLAYYAGACDTCFAELPDSEEKYEPR